MRSILTTVAVQLRAPSLPNKAGGKPIGYLPTLDGWRFVAIGYVILAHIGDSLANMFRPGWEPFARFMHATGEFGVHIFFGISGFLITSRLLEEQMVDGRVSLKRFYIRRAFRILPPVVAFLGVAGILGVLGIVRIHLGHWLSALFFYANYYRDITWYVGHFWSLAVEEHFYFVWPALFVFFGMRRGFKVAVLLACAVIVWRVVRFKLTFLGTPDGLTAAHTDFQADGLLWGCAVAFLFARPAIREKMKSLLTMPVWAGMMIVIAATVAIEPRWWVLWQGEVALQKLLIPLVIVGTVVRPKGIPGRILEFSPIRWVGRLSYSLYLWQQLFLVTNAERADRMGSLQSFPINILCVLAIATASYYLVERPLIKVGHRLAKPVTPGRPDLRETPTIPAIIAATTPVITTAAASSDAVGQVATT